MIRSTKFAMAFCVAALAGMVVPAAAAKALPCSEWISTMGWDNPGTGHLTGTETRTETFTYVVSATPGGVGGSTTVTQTVTYEVGFYSFGDGTTPIGVDCRDYTLA
jgi:hypothetical protein